MINMHDIRDFGAAAGETQNHTAVIQKTMDTVAEKGGGVVLIPSGLWLTGALQLRSNITLRLSKGAVLRALDNPDAYPHFRHDTWSRMDLFPWRALIFGDSLENVSITGEGTIECGGTYAVFQDKVGDSPDRPYGVHLVNCRGIRIEDVKFRNSAHWMLRCLECANLRIRGVDIFNHCNVNNDGMDIDSCQDVRITDCRVDSSDDGICLKSEGASPCRNVLVSNCIVSSHASAIKLGTGSIGGFQNILVNNCIVRPSRSKEMRHIFNLWKGMTGIDISCVDGGCSENIHFANIAMDGVENPIFVKLGDRRSTVSIPANRRKEEAKPSPEPTAAGSLENLQFRNISASDAGVWPTVITGYEGNCVRRVILRDVDIRCGRLPAPDLLDREPNWDSKLYPCVFCVANGGVLPAYGFVTRHVAELRMENVRVVPASGDPRPFHVSIAPSA